MLTDHLLNRLFIPLYVYSLTRDGGGAVGRPASSSVSSPSDVKKDDRAGGGGGGGGGSGRGRKKRGGGDKSSLEVSGAERSLLSDWECHPFSRMRLFLSMCRGNAFVSQKQKKIVASV